MQTRSQASQSDARQPAQALAEVAKAVDFMLQATRAGLSDVAEFKSLFEFATAAEEREAALASYRKALNAHRRFAAAHDPDDPAHEDHQRQVATTQRTLVASEQVLAVKLAEWRKARGL